MDIMMPEMDGYEAMEIIRKTPEISNVPIIVITAKAMKDDYHEALKHGANDYLSKPVDDTKLINLMKIWLSK
jgi:CheY-like chemotaxis protein